MLHRVSGRLRTFALIVCAHLSSARNARRNHSRSQRPQSFWSAPGIETSGRRQDQTSVNHGLIVKFGKSDWLKIQSKYSAHAHKIGSGQRSGSLVLTKRIAASGDEKARCHATSFIERARWVIKQTVVVRIRTSCRLVKWRFFCFSFPSSSSFRQLLSPLEVARPLNRIAADVFIKGVFKGIRWQIVTVRHKGRP